MDCDYNRFYISLTKYLTSMSTSQWASNSFPGFAGSTGTRVDSAAKHIMACKVHSGMLAQWCENAQSSQNHMHIHKNKYCMTRDELVLNVGMPLNSSSNMIKPGQAYPAVLTTLGDMSQYSQKMLLMLYHVSRQGSDFMKAKDFIQQLCTKSQEKMKALFAQTEMQNSDWNRVCMELKNMPYFTAQGYSLGIAYASALSGDTVGSVLIGGMCTVMNGAFECKAGQMLQWYFDFERNCFYQDNEYNGKKTRVAGTRKEIQIDLDRMEDIQTKLSKLKSITKSDTESEKAREEFHNRALGAMDAYPHGGKLDRKHLIAFPKPYLLTENGEEHYGDKIRIFAKCITGARKHEMMDIMLMTQSL